ncbi:hypothetical protein [Persicitalea jodogahamensis]|uniref:Outer membrane protein beta-barrel domain-containing protein n=1 Tax=Persicitalea jodogahamensis TaxID=402147 RepID=A0A8J3G8Q7_9BACT|nr:hypothetical protein [Persicitalea jodogahamensis]GHB67473.1 hypothetical protein GCM10007390_20980 [Persicitalea jodogahamensis]
MKQAFLLMILAVATCGYAQEAKVEPDEPFIRVYLTASLGMGISGQTSVMSGGPLMALATLPLRFRHNWFLIPEAYGGAFRSPKFPDKTGFIIHTYPRYRHQMYGMRFGRSFAPPDNGFSVLPSIGIDYLQIEEPYFRMGNYRRELEHNIYRLYAIPIQVDLRFQKRRDSYAAFAIGMRVNKNNRRSFGSLTAGVEFKLN